MPQTPRNSPSVNVRIVGDSTWMIPLASCVWSGETKVPSRSMPIPAGTTTRLPSTKTSRCAWMCSVVPSAASAGSPSAASRAASCGPLFAGHGAGVTSSPGRGPLGTTPADDGVPENDRTRPAKTPARTSPRNSSPMVRSALGWLSGFCTSLDLPGASLRARSDDRAIERATRSRRTDERLGRQADRDAGAVARRRGDVHRAAGRLDTDALRGEADVPVRELQREPLGREPAAVVLDRELELPVVLDEPHADASSLCVPDDVGEELARGREDEGLARMAVLVAQVELEGKACAVRRLLRHRADGRLQPGLLEDVRMELEDGLPQLS